MVSIIVRKPLLATPSVLDHLASWFSHRGEKGQIILPRGDATEGPRGSAGCEVVNVPEAASSAGISAEIAASTGELVIVLERSVPDFKGLDALVLKIGEGYDAVFGRRAGRGSGTLSFLLRRFFGSPVHDADAGVAALRRDALRQINPRCTGIESDLELVINAQLHHLRTAEVDFTPGALKQSDPPLALHARWRRLRFLMLYSPRWMLLIPGVLMILLGLLAYVLVFARIPLLGANLDAHTLLAASIAIVLGMQAVWFAVITKTFAITEGLMPPDPRLVRLFAFLNLEKGVMLGAVAILLGLGMLTALFFDWRATGFGPLDYGSSMRRAIPAVTLVALGFQTALCGFFVSVLGIARRDSKSMSMADVLHDSFVHNRRVRVLAEHLIKVLPKNARVLDVGAGDGLLSALILARRPDLVMRGIDVDVRPNTHIPISAFDGKHIPFEDDAFDVVMFVDVLHHTDDPQVLLAEAARVASKWVVLKDHTRNGFLANTTLKFMDRVGNLRYNVPLPYNYWSREQWLAAFGKLGLGIGEWVGRLTLYPFPLGLLFDRSLHFIARLDVGQPTQNSPTPSTD